MNGKEKFELSVDGYRAIFENTGGATAIIEQDTTISKVNRKFEELSGYPKEEIEGKKSALEFVMEKDLKSDILPPILPPF